MGFAALADFLLYPVHWLTTYINQCLLRIKQADGAGVFIAGIYDRSIC